MGANPLLTAAETAAIEARVKALEARVDAQVVAAVVGRSDTYHGLRWRAFAIAAALGGLGAVLADELRPGWQQGHAVLLAVALALGAGAAAALAATLLPGFARLFLEPLRAEAEITRQAESLFLRRELFGTRRRNAVLLLASSFERRSAVFADRGLRTRIPDAAWIAVTSRMNRQLAGGRTADALLAGLKAAEPLLAAAADRRTDGAPNELADRPVAAAGSP
jgi:uncharacterized membrane protein